MRDQALYTGIDPVSLRGNVPSLADVRRTRGMRRLLGTLLLTGILTATPAVAVLIQRAIKGAGWTGCAGRRPRHLTYALGNTVFHAGVKCGAGRQGASRAAFRRRACHRWSLSASDTSGSSGVCGNGGGCGSSNKPDNSRSNKDSKDSKDSSRAGTAL